MHVRYFLAPLLFALAPLSIAAHEHHQHDDHGHSLGAHVHGVAALNIALEDQQLEIHLASPAMNIVGFEYQPTSAADKKIVLDAERTLKNEQALFALPSAAQCVLSSVSIDNDLSAPHSEHQHDTDHDHAATHSEDEHEHQHSDIQVNYLFNCAAPHQLNSIDVAGLFKAFPHTEKINVQLVTPAAQHGMELSPSQTLLSW